MSKAISDIFFAQGIAQTFSNIGRPSYDLVQDDPKDMADEARRHSTRRNGHKEAMSGSPASSITASNKTSGVQTPVPLPPQAAPGFRPSAGAPIQDAASNNSTPADTPSRPVLTMKRTGGVLRRSTAHGLLHKLSFPVPSPASDALREAREESAGDEASHKTSSLAPDASKEAEPEVLRVVSDIADADNRNYTSMPPATAQQFLKRKANDEPHDAARSQRPRTSSIPPTFTALNGVKAKTPASEKGPVSQDSTIQDSMFVDMTSDDEMGFSGILAGLLSDPDAQDLGPDHDDTVDDSVLDVNDMEDSMADGLSFMSASPSHESSIRNLRARTHVSNLLTSVSYENKQRKHRLDSSVPESLTETLMGRPYTSWNDGTRLVPTGGVLLPDKYKMKVVSNMPWTCPIRSCRQIFYTIGSLSKHWQKTHFRCKLNDNGDGTFSIKGHYEASSSTTRLSRTPAVVVSRNPLDQREPPAAVPHYVKPAEASAKPQEESTNRKEDSSGEASGEGSGDAPLYGEHVLFNTARPGEQECWESRRTIEMATKDRAYRQWIKKNGTLTSAAGALIPSGYKFSTYPGHSWVCPVRTCRRVFPQLLNLGVHFVRGHFGHLFNDNQDGTLSDLGIYKAPGGSFGKKLALPPRVLTSRPLDPNEPPMVEDNLPNQKPSTIPPHNKEETESTATNLTPIPPPPAPAAAKRTVTTASGLVLEPDTDWQPAALTADSWQNWSYIRPHLQNHKGDIIPDTGHIRELLCLPRVRDIDLNRDYIKYYDSTPKDISALLVNLTGDPAPQPCSRCQTGKGPFKGCIVLKTSAPVDQQRAIRSCGNCLYHNNQTNCSLRQTLVKRVMELFPIARAQTEDEYWRHHESMMSHNRSKYNESKRLGLIKVDGLGTSTAARSKSTSSLHTRQSLTQDEHDTSASGTRRSGRLSAMEATADSDRRLVTVKAPSGLRKSSSSLGGGSAAASSPVTLANQNHIGIDADELSASLLAGAAAQPTSSSALISAGHVQPTMAAETLEMEDWEMAPGRIRSQASTSMENIAFSNPYLTTNQAVTVDDAIAFHVEVIRAGQTRRLAPEAGTTRICSLAAGKLRVRIDGEPAGARFAIGPHGMFKLKPGVGATIENRLYIDSVLHMSSVSTGL